MTRTMKERRTDEREPQDRRPSYIRRLALYFFVVFSCNPAIFLNLRAGAYLNLNFEKLYLGNDNGPKQ
jgi:hypothetical protein